MELRFVKVEGPLWQPREVKAVGRVDWLVVGNDRMAQRNGALHLLAVEHVFHGQYEVRIGTRAGIAAHHQVGVQARLCLEDLMADRVADALHGARVDRRDKVQIAGQQRVDARTFVADAHVFNLVKVRTARLPVALVAHRD